VLTIRANAKGVGNRGALLHWIFIHGTDIVDGSLLVLFFGLFFPLLPLLEIFMPTLLVSASL